MANDYLCILEFLKNYSGRQYKKLEKCELGEERTIMIHGSELGKKARAAFSTLVDIIESRFGFEHDRITQWQNSGTFVSYFWCQMKRQENKDSHISLSLFAEKTGGEYRFRVSIELAVENAKNDDLIRYKKLLDMPLNEALVYVSGGNNEAEFRVLGERDNKIVRNNGLKKVQVSYIYDEKQYVNDKEFESSLLEAAALLVPYYDALFDSEVPEQVPLDNPVVKEKREESVKISTEEAIARIKEYISGQGFSYPDGLIENFFLSLKSKPFVILAGTSGTGKTRLVKLFADAIGAEYKMVSVRPDWSDGSDLFGYKDLNEKPVLGPVCDAFKTAQKNPDKPVLLCLDEMNLARVEFYLSDFLSVIESREKQSDGKIVTGPIAQYPCIPENLYVIGTVNMDETTFPFSKKVLDRANTIEFNYVDLKPEFGKADSDAEPLQLQNSFLRTEYLVLARDCEDEREFVVEICDELQKINEILRAANAHVGYRVRDEIVFYMLNNKKADNLITDAQAMDNEIMQKILPRIQGSKISTKEMLVELFKYCVGNHSGLDTESGSIGKHMDTIANSGSVKYPESAKKIAYMMTRYEEDGFTSYWL